MNHLTKLFRLLQITRAQPQYGYALAEIQKHELSDLAQHHYLVTFIAWQLARLANKAGAKLDIEKVLSYSLIHDLGELFGGDISMPYAKANPAARKAAKAFERENQKYLAKFFADDADYFDQLSAEIMDAKSDEALISKLADYIECAHFKLYVRRLTTADLALNSKKLLEMVDKLRDPKARSTMKTFIAKWLIEVDNGRRVADLFEEDKT